MDRNLKTIFDIQEVLKSVGYNDFQRISNEIYDYSFSSKVSLEEIFSDLKNNVPWEYIKESADFLQNEFIVNKDTLIPRLETEDLVLKAYDLIKNSSTPFESVVDVGTGSGCIIISLLKIINDDNYKCVCNFIATDISNDAIDIAKLNSQRILGNSNSISFVNANLIKDIETNAPVLFLANLPYIPTKQYRELDKSVKEYEPQWALDGGEDGLKYYKELFDQIVSRNITDCKILIEIEPSTLEDCIDLISKSFSKYEYTVLKDFRSLNRFVLISLY